MISTSSREFAFVTLVACLLLLGSSQRLDAQEVDPLEALIDKIVKGSSAKEEDDPKKDNPETEPKIIKEETLSNGIKHAIRSDGVEIFTRPDGTQQFVTPDGKVVTIRGKNRQRVIQIPGKKPKEFPPKVDDPEEFRTHRSPPAIAPPNPKFPAPKKPLREWVPPTPTDNRKHATYEELKLDPRMPRSLIGESSNDAELPLYSPPPPGQEDELIDRKQTPAKSIVFRLKSGAIQTTLPSGMTVTTYPGLPQATVQNEKGEIIKTITPAEDGSNRTKIGNETVMFDPATGRLYVDYGESGFRETIGPDGKFGASDGEGGKEWRGKGGELIASEIKDSGSGYTVRMDNDVATVLDPVGKPVGIGIRTKFGWKTEDVNGNEIFISELVNLEKFRPNAAVRLTNRNSWDQKPTKGQYKPPAMSNIFEAISALVKRDQKTGGNILRKTDKRTLQKLKAIEEASSKLKRGANGADDLSRSLELWKATLKKSELESQLKQLQEGIVQQEAELDLEKKRVDGEKAQLLLSENRAENRLKKTLADKLALQVERNGLTQLQVVLKLQEEMVKRLEKMVADDLDKAVARLDYSKYNLCPNGKPFDKCDHQPEKRKWLNAQLSELLGKDGVARLKNVKKKRADLDKQKKELDSKEKAIKDKEKAIENAEQEAKDQIASLKNKRDQLSAKENGMQKQLDESQQQEKKVVKQISALDAAISKLIKPKSSP